MTSQTKPWSIVLAIIITAVIVGGGMYYLQAQKPSQTNTEQVSAPDKLVDDAIVGTAIEQGYDFSSGQRDGFTSLSKGNIIFMAKKAIAVLYENDENITSVYTPEHPTNADIILISTSGNTSGKWPDLKSTNKIYSYDIKTDAIIQLYEEHEDRTLRTMGMDGSKLVLMYNPIDNSPGPCFSIWADWESFGYLELADIQSGLQPYTVPDYQVEIGKAEQEKCIEEMEF